MTVEYIIIQQGLCQRRTCTHQIVGYMSDLSESVFVCFRVNSMTHGIIAHVKPGITCHFTPGTGSTDKHIQTSPLFQLLEVFSQPV